jgi:hypothetical protein
LVYLLYNNAQFYLQTLISAATFNATTEKQMVTLIQEKNIDDGFVVVSSTVHNRPPASTPASALISVPALTPISTSAHILTKLKIRDCYYERMLVHYSIDAAGIL